MAYTFNVKGMEETTAAFERLGRAAHGVAKAALFEGSAEMADRVNREIVRISATKFKWASTKRGETRKPSREEKAILKEAGTGIAKFKGSGTEVETTVSIKEGYWMLGKKAKAARQIANAVNSGTSFMPKQPFFRRAVTLGKKQVIKKMENVIFACVDAITSGQAGTGKGG